MKLEHAPACQAGDEDLWLSVLIDRSHEKGMDFIASLRMGAVLGVVGNDQGDDGQPLQLGGLRIERLRIED